MTNIKQNINYARDDVFIISINKSADRIEELESKLYLEPTLLFAYYSLISALFSKTKSYVNSSDKVDIKLKEIRKELFKEGLLDELENIKLTHKTKTKFLIIFDKLINIYRYMARNYSEVGLFPKKNSYDSSIPSVAR